MHKFYRCTYGDVAVKEVGLHEGLGLHSAGLRHALTLAFLLVHRRLAGLVNKILRIC